MDGFKFHFTRACGGADDGINLGVAIEDQVFSRNLDDIFAFVVNFASEGFVVNRQRDFVAYFKLTGDLTSHCDRCTAGFCRADDVIGAADRVYAQRRAFACWCFNGVGLAVVSDDYFTCHGVGSRDTDFNGFIVVGFDV